MVSMRFGVTTVDVPRRRSPGGGRSPLSSDAHRETLEAAGVSGAEIEALRELAELEVEEIVPPPDSLPSCRLIV
jgi:hypothetical protein